MGIEYWTLHINDTKIVDVSNEFICTKNCEYTQNYWRVCVDCKHVAGGSDANKENFLCPKCGRTKSVITKEQFSTIFNGGVVTSTIDDSKEVRDIIVAIGKIKQDAIKSAIPDAGKLNRSLASVFLMLFVKKLAKMPVIEESLLELYDAPVKAGVV